MDLGPLTSPRLLGLLLGLLLAAALVAGLPGVGAPPALADDPDPGAPPAGTTLGLDGDGGKAGQVTALRLALATAEDAAPVADAALEVERRVDGSWQPAGVVTTDEAGRARLEVEVRREPGDNVVRAAYAGDAAHDPASAGPLRLALERRPGKVRLTGAHSVVDEQRLALHVRWTAGSGMPVAGRVTVQQRTGKGHQRHWKRVTRVVTDDRGRGSLVVRPRSDARYRAVAPRLAWVTEDRSAVHRVENLPPGRPVAFPRRAPRPRVHLPHQPHALGAGPHVTITRVPAGVWRRMAGRSWHPGCPVGRAGLRYLRINYWDYDGYRRRGELVANADAVGRMAGALAEMYDRRLPIRSMYLVDRFGWSSKVRGGNDFRSMAAGNTSAFNCRDVVNRPGVRSPHATGRALDVNTWENPYRSARGLVPNSWWQSRSHPRVAWRSRSHDEVALMARHGLRWTYGLGDTQHFDAPAGNGRYAARPAGCGDVCD